MSRDLLFVFFGLCLYFFFSEINPVNFYFVPISISELIITRPPKNATVLLNKRHLLHCEASGKPKPRVRWYHNNEEMTRYGINYRVRSSGALRFREVKVQDRGIYRCQVESGKESLFSDPAHLVVEGNKHLHGVNINWA